MSRNLHQLFYKDYFRDKKKGNYIDFSYLTIKDGKVSDSDKKIIDGSNKSLCERNLLEPIPRPDGVTHHPKFKVLYPGLATGVGIGHEAKIEGEFKLGMHFDWTYGMPVVYGSSVKGVLRSYFEDFYKPKTESKKEQEEEVDKLIVDIFGEDEKLKKKGYKNKKSIYDRDIFFDAVIVETKDSKGRILCPDSITPHLQGPLKNPIPITFMKIAPGCVMEFRFKLVDSVIKLKDSDNPLVLKAEEKLETFKEILTTVGIGAKTNVGYGQLEAL